MVDRCRSIVRDSPVGVALAGMLVALFGLVTIIVAPVAFPTDRRAARTEDRGAAAPAEAHGPASSVTIGWVGDMTPGSQYGLPPADGRALFSAVRTALREPDLMVGNLEGTFSQGGVSKCGAGAPNCYAFQAPPANAGALRDAGFDLLNLANNHSFDYGPAGQRQTLTALNDAQLAFTGLPGQVRVLSRRGI